MVGNNEQGPALAPPFYKRLLMHRPGSRETMTRCVVERIVTHRVDLWGCGYFLGLIYVGANTESKGHVIFTWPFDVFNGSRASNVPLETVS